MNYQYISLEKDDCLSLITLNRPEVMNAYHKEMLLELQRALEEIRKEDEIRIIILTGMGSKSFSVGADLDWLEDLTPRRARELSRLGQSICSDIEQSSKIVLAAINGYALGGGLELALACDLRLASSRARFGQPEVKLGLVPGFDGTQRLPRMVGMGLAKELMFTGKIIDASEAYEVGLINRLVTPRDLLRSSRKLGRQIANHVPEAVGLIKSAINHGIREGHLSGSSYETEAFGTCFAREDYPENIRDSKGFIDENI
ncbi:enoyl-CoA hydratase-related protein [Halarsenatibacter silvermanii]|uniref:Enoyl-CoA hydratase n=1 Tax=Halarsenatibacter silvermanii TaxID=321763 RepID=A0A1G9HY93_9FIRM|nr:enoyl-CoA hydratase-related protein [Halarsenatibacter silvermanii]SDL17785.1 enoyl-CoA hydratase [Halarsenatibacter silvermanii]